MLRLVFNSRQDLHSRTSSSSEHRTAAAPPSEKPGNWVRAFYLDASELRCSGFNQKVSVGQTQDMLERKCLSASWEHFGVALEVLEVVALDSEASASLLGLLSWISSRKLTG